MKEFYCAACGRYKKIEFKVESNLRRAKCQNCVDKSIFNSTPAGEALMIRRGKSAMQQYKKDRVRTPPEDYNLNSTL